MRSWTRLLYLTPLAAAAALLQCTSFPTLRAGSCGNGVVEPNAPHPEDCDTFPQAGCSNGGKGQCCGDPSAGAQACRFLCTGSAACPDGWGCGTDSICRQASGRFSQLGQDIAAGAWRVSLGDFDGDGLEDALTREKVDARGASRIRVHYFASDGSLVGEITPSSRFGWPLVGDLTGDGLADVAFINNDGISVMAGQANRTMAPLSYPLFTIPIPMLWFFAVPFPDGPHEFFWGDPGSGNGLYVAGSGETPSAKPISITALPDPANGVVNTPFTAAVFPINDYNPCPELIYTTNDPTQAVKIWSPCSTHPVGTCNGVPGPVGWNCDQQPQSVALPAGVTMCLNASDPTTCGNGVHVGDMNADGNVDLVIGAMDQSSSKSRVYVAYGDGLGHFNSREDLTGTMDVASGSLSIDIIDALSPPEPPDASAPDGAPPVDAGASYSVELEAVLAVGNINLTDSVADLVLPSLKTPSDKFPGSILISLDKGLYYVAQRQPVGLSPWTEAAIADLNGNGLPDIVAGSDSALDIDFFNGSGSIFVYPFSIPTGGGVSHFAISDYDGDLINDLAFAQSVPGGGNQVFISYGLFSAPPAAPLYTGSFGAITQTVPAAPAPVLAVVSQAALNGNPAVAITLLVSAGDRPPLSTYTLRSFTSMGGLQSSAVNLASGSFTGSAYPDLVAMGLNLAPNANPARFNPYLWLVPNAQGPASFGSPVPSAPLTSTASDYQMLVDTARLDTSTAPSVVVVARDAPASPTSTLWVGKVSNGAPTVTSTQPLDVFVTEEGQMKLADVDGDGYADLVLLTGRASSKRALLVYWNNGGQIDTTSPATVASCDVAGCGDCPQGFTLLNADPKALPSIAFVSHGGATRAQPKGRSFTMSDLGVGSSVDEAGAPLACDASAVGGGPTYFYTGIAAGDVNGDGVDDLALVDNGTLRIFAGKAVTP